MEKSKKVIELPKTERERLCKIFRTNKATISQSLTFARNGDTHLRIRLAAMRNGGRLLVECDKWNVDMLK